MSYQRYQGYQYETSPRKIQPEYETTKNPYKGKKTLKQKVKKQKNKKQLKSKAKLVMGIMFAFSLLLAISYQNSQITESFNEKEELKKNLSTIEKENEQLQVNIEKSLNLNKIEQSAKEMLGMQKLNNNQKVYISLPKQDYVESNTNEVVIEEKTTFWEEIINYIKNFIK